MTHHNQIKELTSWFLNVDEFYVYEFYVYEYVTMCECVFNIWILILCVMRHCRWQYCVCDDEFDTYNNNIFFCFDTRGAKQNW
jgi:hypothetical protein